MDGCELVVRDAGLEGHWQWIRPVQPLQQLLHELRHILGLWRQVDDALGTAVADDVLPVAIGRWPHTRSASTHDQRMKLPHGGPGQFLLPDGRIRHQPLDLFQSRIIAFDFIPVALPAGKIAVCGDDLNNLLLGEPIPLDHGRIMCGEKPRRIS